jgi:cytochrome c biogenesis protein
VFHFAVLALLVGVAWGSWYGWHGNRLVVADGFGFCNTPQQFDEYAFGPRTGAGALPRFCLELKDFRAEYIENGQPVRFQADVSYVEGVGGPPQAARVEVNEPLRLDGATVYLLGHGYAPILRYTDARGTTHTTVAPFLPDDGMLTSLGVATFPGATVDPADPGGEPAQVGVPGRARPCAEARGVPGRPGPAGRRSAERVRPEPTPDRPGPAA